MTRLPDVGVLLVAFVACVGCGGAAAQTAGAKPWPTRVVRIVLPGSPGAGSDIIGRVLAQPLTKSFGQTFIIDNRPGAANIIASRALFRAVLSAALCPVARSEMLERLSKPTAITVSKIIKVSVTISAKPAAGFLG